MHPVTLHELERAAAARQARVGKPALIDSVPTQPPPSAHVSPWGPAIVSTVCLAIAFGSRRMEYKPRVQQQPPERYDALASEEELPLQLQPGNERDLDDI